METGFQLLASIVDAEDLDRARDRGFGRIFALLETLAPL
jgi:hypothetical protein